MKSSEQSSIESRWARLGVFLNTAPARKTPDIERLLVESGLALSSNARLLPLVVTWLVQYGDFVAKHRLKKLIAGEALGHQRAAAGLILETAIANGAARDLGVAAEACVPVEAARPLFDVQRESAELSRIAERNASEISRKWGLWAPDVELKLDAIRPVTWLLEKNPALRSRVVRKGDLRCSILEVLRHDVAGQVRSEAELARLSGATRPAVGSALRALVLEGEVRVVPRAMNGRDFKVVLTHAA